MDLNGDSDPGIFLTAFSFTVPVVRQPRTKYSLRCMFQLCTNVSFYTVSQKTSHFVVSISSPNMNRFSIFFRWHILWTICNNGSYISHHTLTALLHYILKYKYVYFENRLIFGEDMEMAECDVLCVVV